MKSGIYWLLANVVVVGSVGLLWSTRKPTNKPSVKLVYSPQGLGGYVPDNPAPAEKSDVLVTARTLYNTGKYQLAEQEAERVMTHYEAKGDENSLRTAALAQRLHAYSAAKRGDYQTARERFGYLHDKAEQLPDKGAIPPTPGETQPTLAEEGVFQQAVCTSGMGDKGKAETEFNAFLTRYPESILVHAAVKRISRYHEGNVPKPTERLWKQAMALQRQKDEKIARQNALCGAKCLQELLRRQGKQANLSSLADELGTTGEGTTLLSLQSALKKRGLSSEGYQMDLAHLKTQKFPAIALLNPTHFVLLEGVEGETLRVWDSDTTPAVHSVPASAWSGILLVLK